MSIATIPIVTVCYNTPDLVEDLIESIRKFYPNQIYVIDGSDEISASLISAVVDKHANVRLIHLNYNIHHGPGMTWAFRNLSLGGPVLVLDSDIHVNSDGFIESLAAHLRPNMYGVGCVTWTNRGGFDVVEQNGALRYLWPILMLCNIEVVNRWPMPVKHGSPMIEAMLALHDAHQSDLLGHVEWVKEDIFGSKKKNFVVHRGQGTVLRAGTYHLEEWQAKRGYEMISGQGYNRELLSLIPQDARGVVEVGCNNGMLAGAYKSIHPKCLYTGIEVDAEAAEQARAYCDVVLNVDIESVGDEFFRSYSSSSNVWVFGDVLEHLRDPWRILKVIAETLPRDGCVVICLPNAQHWSVQAKLGTGTFRYEDNGLLDRTHIRFFTRITMIEMLQGAGLGIELGVTRNFGELTNNNIKSAIKSMAVGFGVDPEQALADSLPFQYVVKAVPILDTSPPRNGR
jgi:SAM-dependent methyltransferase